MAEQIIINVTDSIPPINQATIDLNGQTGNTYAKSQLDTKLNDAKAGVKGVATQSNAPTPYTVETYPNGLFESWKVIAPITSPNSWGNIAVTAGEIATNTVFFNVTNGVVTKELSAKVVADPAKLPLYSAIKSANIVATTQFVDDENGNVVYRVKTGQTLAVGELPVNFLGSKVERVGGADLSTLPQAPNLEIVNANYDYSTFVGSGSPGSSYHMHRNYAVTFKGALRELSIKLQSGGNIYLAAFRVVSGTATLLHKYTDLIGVTGENVFPITDNYLLEVGDFIGVSSTVATWKDVTNNSQRVPLNITTPQAVTLSNIALAYSFKTSKSSIAPDILRKETADALYVSKSIGNSTPRLIDAFYKWIEGEKYPIGIMGDSTTDGDSTTGQTSHSSADTASGGVGKADHQPPNAYTTKLQTALRAVTGNGVMRIYNLGYSGSQINTYKNNINALLSGPYSDVKMMGIRYGINDRLLYTTYSAFFNGMVTDLSATVDALLAKGIQPFLITTQPILDASIFTNSGFPLRTSEAIKACVGDAIKKVSEKYDLEIIDLNSTLYTLMNESSYNIATVFGDGLHFGDLGHKLTSDALFAKLYPSTIFTDARDKILLSFDNQKIKSNITAALTKFNTDADGFKMKSNFASASDILIAEFTVFADRQYKIQSFGTATVTVNGAAYTTDMIVQPGLVKLTARTGALSSVDFRGFKMIKQ